MFNLRRQNDSVPTYNLQGIQGNEVCCVLFAWALAAGSIFGGGGSGRFEIEIENFHIVVGNTVRTRWSDILDFSGYQLFLYSE